MRRFALATALGIACIVHTSDAPACGVAYPAGSFARFSEEKSLIVWDAAKKTEHFVRALSLKGDPQTFGVFVPTPTLPQIAKEKDDIIEHVAELFIPPTPPQPKVGSGDRGPAATAAAPPPVQVLERTQIGDFEAVTLKATDEKALGEWLAKNKFVDKPALRAWEKTYLDKKWLITAVRCTAQGNGDRQLEVPTMRLSFSIDAPFFPYTEVPADANDENAYNAKYSHPGYNYGTRPFDVYVIAPSQMQGMMGASTGGPPVADSIRVPNDTVANALGDTKSWSSSGFDPKSQPHWVITHLSENVWQRNAPKDLTFASYDLPHPRPGPGESGVDDRPNGPVFPASSMAWMNPQESGGGKKPSHTRGRIGAIALFLLIAGAAGYAVLSEQDKKRKTKS